MGLIVNNLAFLKRSADNRARGGVKFISDSCDVPQFSVEDSFLLVTLPLSGAAGGMRLLERLDISA